MAISDGTRVRLSVFFDTAIIEQLEQPYPKACFAYYGDMTEDFETRECINLLVDHNPELFPLVRKDGTRLRKWLPLIGKKKLWQDTDY